MSYGTTTFHSVSCKIQFEKRGTVSYYSTPATRKKECEAKGKRPLLVSVSLIVNNFHFSQRNRLFKGPYFAVRSCRDLGLLLRGKLEGVQNSRGQRRSDKYRGAGPSTTHGYCLLSPVSLVSRALRGNFLAFASDFICSFTHPYTKLPVNKNKS